MSKLYALASLNYTSGAAVPKRRIVKFDATDNVVILGAAATDKLIGVTTDLAATASGERIDVVRAGLAPVEYGGPVTRGDLLTSDATGRAVAAAPGTGVNNYVIGIAEVSGVVGQIGSVFIAPGRIQG